MATYREVLAWVNDPARTVQEHQGACRALGLDDRGNQRQLRSRLRDHINQQNQDAQAPWSPGEPVPPRRPQPAPRAQRATQPWGWLGFGVAVMAAAILLVLAGTYAWRMVSTAPLLRLPTIALPRPVVPAVPLVAKPVLAATSVREFPLYESEGGIPYQGTTWTADVAPDEIEVFTGGSASIAGVNLPGGVERGSVIVLLPDPQKVVHYMVSNLVPGANWHGAYRPVQNPTAESSWRKLVEDRVEAMRAAPNCSSGKGCEKVDVLIVGPGGIVKQWTVN